MMALVSSTGPGCRAATLSRRYGIPLVRQTRGVSPEPDDPVSFFAERGFVPVLSERDLHAEHLASGEPGRASFYVKGRRYFCVDLMRENVLVAARYSAGESADDALRSAMRRYRWRELPDLFQLRRGRHPRVAP
jgi:hypothetical protein